MSPIDTGLLLAIAGGLLLGALAGVSIGLWLGERGRRQDAQRREAYGNPIAPRATVTEAPPGPEERLQDIGFSATTIERGVKTLMQEAKAAGRPMSRSDAEAQVKQMLSPDYQPPEIPSLPL